MARRFSVGLVASLLLHTHGEDVTLADATKSTSALEEYLKSHPAGSLTLPDPSGMRLAHWAASGGNVDVLKLLGSKGADPWDGTATPEEHSALHMACRSGHADVVKHMLTAEALKLRSRGPYESAKVAAETRDKRDTPCLHMAALAGGVDVIKELAAVGADMKADTKRFGTALHAAAAVGQVDVVKELLNHGLDVCAKNSKGETPGARAREEEMDEVIALLASKEEAAGCGKKKKKDKRKKSKEL